MVAENRRIGALPEISLILTPGRSSVTRRAARLERAHRLRETIEPRLELSWLAGEGEADIALAAGTELGAAPHGDTVGEAVLRELLGGHRGIHADEHVECA